MKVLIILFADYPGSSAPANHAQRTALALKSAGAEVTILGLSPASNPQNAGGVDRRGIRYTTFPLPRLRILRGYPGLVGAYRRGVRAKLAETLAREHFDVLLYHGRSWYAARPICELARQHGAAFATFQMEWHAASFPRVVNGSFPDQAAFRKWMLPATDGLVGISTFWAEYAGSLGLPCVVIPAFADLACEATPPRAVRSAGTFKIVFVGSFHARELPETMFEGLRLAIQRGVDLELVIIGNKRRAGRALAGLEAMPELSNRTTFTGWISDEQLGEHLRSASAFVLLREDDRETKALFPTRLPEYLVTGNPVVLSAAGDLPIYLRHRESAWIIPPGDAPKALADAIVHLANNEDERQKIGLGGFDVARRELSIQPLGEKLNAFLSRIVNDRAAAVRRSVTAQTASANHG